ncbi:rubrerythrin-like domain-containing protein [Haloprofundus marisrubri]|uniref:rubrerythrin-like domain-containing protein n=1 Tax=Haloprofundus marisrubri TaxID=1514971 RepID=UPI0012BA64CA|nr:rubrerythrin-like domain-containing protein [Haloprofundus marisrubri]
MAIYNAPVDPYSPERGYYECLTCGSRETSTDHLTTCSSCGGDVRNLAVPRE